MFGLPQPAVRRVRVKIPDCYADLAALTRSCEAETLTFKGYDR
jgi:hypothetical protein